MTGVPVDVSPPRLGIALDRWHGSMSVNLGTDGFCGTCSDNSELAAVESIWTHILAATLIPIT